MSTPPRRMRPHPVRAALAATVLVLLAGCSILGGSKEPTTIYAPEVATTPDPSWPRAGWQLSISPTQAARFIDGSRIAVRPTPGELQVYKDARWAKRPGEQLEDAVLHALEDSGRIAGVARQASGIAADYKLAMDLRHFESDYAGQAVPAATVEVSAKLLRSEDQAVVAARVFRQAEPAEGTDAAQVAQAFGRALATIGHDIAGWTLASGNADAAGPRAPAPAATR